MSGNKESREKVCINNSQLRLQPPPRVPHASNMDQLNGNNIVGKQALHTPGSYQCSLQKNKSFLTQFYCPHLAPPSGLASLHSSIDCQSDKTTRMQNANKNYPISSFNIFSRVQKTVSLPWIRIFINTPSYINLA